MNIEVTKEDILAGKPGSKLHCPIALAMQRAYQDKTVCVCIYTAYLGPLADRRVRLPWQATNFILKFDRSRFKRLLRRIFFKPLSFEVQEEKI